MTQFLTSMIADARTVVLAAISLAATVYVAAVWWRTKALVPTLTAVVMAGVVLYAVNNVDTLQAGVEADSTDWIDVGAADGR
ncbi:hypothetical protein BH23ACT9_BH23ACT9_27910 [soil metagenome]